LADIRLKIVEHEERPCLELVISAVGPQVQPIPGFAGMRGANRQTAEQIENILTGHFSFAVKTTAADGSPPRYGTWRAGRRGAVPQRRLGPDGRIDFLAVTPREYPLELIVETGGLGEGRQTTELWFDGMPRLRLTYQVTGKQVRIVAFDSLGHAPPAETPVNAEQKDDKDTNEPPKEKPLKPPVTDAEWDARDLEGKWVLYQKLIRADEKNIKAFTPYLAERKDFDFLEVIALHQSLYQGGIAASWALAKADAPQWLRVAAWLRPVDIDHGETETAKLLVKHNPAKSLAWLDKYAAEAFISKDEKETSRFGDRSNPLLHDLQVLKKKKVKAGDLGKALPPFQPSEVFRYLDAPKTLDDFGDRKRAEVDKVYVHQVLRAIKALVQSGRCREPWIGKLLQLTKHTDPEVRQAAFLAFADFGNELDPKNSPIDDFRKVMDDAKETAAIRESALMAFSSISHPQVYVRLHELALETDHPAWPAAISRLNDIGDEFTLEHLNGENAWRPQEMGRGSAARARRFSWKCRKTTGTRCVGRIHEKPSAENADALDQIVFRQSTR
jgi:hypothetical protein